MADAADDDRQPFFRDLGECFREIYRYWWQELSKIESRTTSVVDLGTPCCIRGPRGGRPSFDIPPSVLEELRGLGFTWTCIAKMLNVSRSTINRRVADHGLQDASKFSEITDAELDHLTQDYISRHGPTIGQSYLIGQLRSLRLRVQRDRVRPGVYHGQMLDLTSHCHASANRGTRNVQYFSNTSPSEPKPSHFLQNRWWDIKGWPPAAWASYAARCT